MRKKSLREQYKAFVKGDLHVQHFLTEARNSRMFGITPLHSLGSVVNILKNKGVIAENDFNRHDSLVKALNELEGEQPSHRTLSICELEQRLEAHKNSPGKGKRRDTSEEREGSRQASIRTTEKTHKDKSKYTRKIKHKKPLAEQEITDLQVAIDLAKRLSAEEGVVQHVNDNGGKYTISDWYDSDSTVASYEDGRELYEAGSKGTVSSNKLMKLAAKAKYYSLDAGLALTSLAIEYDNVPVQRIIDILASYDLELQDLKDVPSDYDSSSDDSERWTTDDLANKGLLENSSKKTSCKCGGSCKCTKSKKLTESKKDAVTSELDRFRLVEIEYGIAYELGQMDVGFLDSPTSDHISKAKKKVLRNLKKDCNYYTNLKSGNKKQNVNKRSDLPTYVDKKNSNLVDKKNQQKKLNEAKIVKGLKKLIVNAVVTK